MSSLYKCKPRSGTARYKMQNQVRWAPTKCKHTQQEYSVQFFQGMLLLVGCILWRGLVSSQKHVPLGDTHEICILSWENGSSVIGFQIAVNSKRYIHCAFCRGKNAHFGEPCRAYSIPLQNKPKKGPKNIVF